MKDRLLGAWHLKSWAIHYSNRDEVTYPYGDEPLGMLVYTGDGWMNAVISLRDRQPLPDGVSPRKMDPELLADAYRSFFQYSGRYRVEGDTVIHSVTQALVPNMIGTEQVRQARFEEGDLYLQGEESLGAQVTRIHRLHWCREAV